MAGARATPGYVRVGEEDPSLGPLRWGAGVGGWPGKLGGQCRGHSPGGPLIPVGPRLPMSPLGPMGPGSPRAPTRSGGEISSALASCCPDPAPQPAPTISREQRGPRGFSGSGQPWSWGRGPGSSRVPALSATRGGGGRVCWAAQDPREIRDDPGPQGGGAGSRQSRDWHLIPRRECALH